MKDDKNNKTSLINAPEIKPILQSLLSKTLQSFSHTNLINDIIKHTLQYREQKGLIFATTSDSRAYITQLWQHFFDNVNNLAPQNQPLAQSEQSDQNHEQITFTPKPTNQIILQAALLRENCIWDELKDNRLKIQLRSKYIERPFPQDISKNKETKQLDESKASANSEKDFIQFVKHQKLQREKRKKLLEIQHEKQLKRQRKQKEEEQKIKQIEENRHRQQKRLKQQQISQKRQSQKQAIKRHQSAYNQFQAKIYHPTAKQQPLNLLHRFESQELKKIKQEKQKLYKSFDKSQLDQHQKSYVQAVQKKNEERYKRIEEIKQIEEMENQKSRIRFKSSFKFEKPQQQYEKKKQEEYLQAKQKRYRILSYREKVKSDFVPQVDQTKKNQLLKLMEDLQFTKKGQYRKKVVKDGQVVFEKIEIKDPREVGLNYLQDIKKQVQKMRAMKRQNNDDFMDSTPQEDPQSKKPIDYLKQMRESKSKSTVSGFTNARKTAFANTKSSQMSFDEKMKKIQEMTTKLMEKTKQQEMLLKYGKFKTSEQILSKKEIIDRNYIDLLNMKLEMIEKGQREFGGR